jgi:hypothetical protein
MTNKELVIAGGGIYVGLQEGLQYEYLVLFNSPLTGTTLALRANEVTTKAVRERIAESDAQFKNQSGEKQ